MFFTDDEPEARNRFLALTDALFQNFRFIVITLSKDDEPQVIFETLTPISADSFGSNQPPCPSGRCVFQKSGIACYFPSGKRRAHCFRSRQS